MTWLRRLLRLGKPELPPAEKRPSDGRIIYRVDVTVDLANCIRSGLIGSAFLIFALTWAANPARPLPIVGGSTIATLLK